MTDLATESRSLNEDGPRVLWWSRSGRDYSRDRIVRQAFGSLGWTIDDFSPTFSGVADLEARITRVDVPDLVWVPCFRQRDAAAAQRWAKRFHVPIVLDSLISAWDKQVFERQKFPEDSRPSRRLLAWETRLFQNSDAVIADTDCHEEFFRDAHGVERSRLAVIPVSADEELFSPQPISPSAGKLNVMFYGSFIGLQGPQFIAEAATQVPEVTWTFLGSGPLLEQCKRTTANSGNVHFVSRVPYDELAGRIGQADVLLGVFGTSQKAARVIPNKVYQSMACARAVITRTSNAYPASLRERPPGDTGITWVPPGDPSKIAAVVRKLAQSNNECVERSQAARKTYEQFFSNRTVSESLQAVLARLVPCRDGIRRDAA